MSAEIATILLVEDEAMTRKTLLTLFEQEGYQVLEAADGEEMQRQLQNNTINLVVLDINLPGKNGLILAEELRRLRSAELGLIFLTGRDNELDKIMGLELGADHYLTKPFNPRELVIHARNLLNRVRTPDSQPPAIRHYQFHNWKLETESRRLIAPDGRVARLPRSEFKALTLLLSEPGKVFSRNALLMAMAGRMQQAHDRTVDVTIRRLRKHFEAVSGTPLLIDTVHGEGYRFSGQLTAN